MPHPKNSQSFWPIAIASYFAIAIVGIAVFISWAIRQNVDLVRKDYYAEELQFQKRLDQMKQARQMYWKPEISYDRVNDRITLSLPQRGTAVFGKIQFYRPSDAALDQHLQLRLNVDGSQAIDAHKLDRGLWRVRVTWQADAKEFFSEETVVIDRS